MSRVRCTDTVGNPHRYNSAAGDSVFSGVSLMSRPQLNKYLAKYFLSNLPDPDNPQNSIDRFLGYKKALEHNNIVFDPSLVYLCPVADFKDGYTAAEKLINDHDTNIDALHCITDLTAIGAINYFNEKNIRIPEEIAVLGFLKKDIKFKDIYKIIYETINAHKNIKISSPPQHKPQNNIKTQKHSKTQNTKHKTQNTKHRSMLDYLVVYS